MLEAYSNRDLQNLRSVLIRAKREKIKIDALLLLVERSIDVPKQEKQKTKKSNSICPSCGKIGWGRICDGNMFCVRCRYSRRV